MQRIWVIMMTKTAKEMFKDMGYEYSEKYTSDDEKALEYIQYKSEYATIKFYIRGKFWANHVKKELIVQNMNLHMQRWEKQKLLFSSVKN